MTPRPHHLSFTRAHLPALMAADAEALWRALNAPTSDAYLALRWRLAAVADPTASPSGPAPHGAQALGEHGSAIPLIIMPPALAPGEAIFAALTMDAHGPQLFTYERQAAPDGALSPQHAALVARGLDGQRVEYGVFTGLALEDLLTHLGRLRGESLTLVRVGSALDHLGPAGPHPGADLQDEDSPGLTLQKHLMLLAGWPLASTLMLWLWPDLLFHLEPALSWAILAFKLYVAIQLARWTHATLQRVAQGAPCSPALGAASWFIPGLNLALPPLALRHAWRAAYPDAQEDDSALIWAWWPLWVMSLLWQLLFRIGVGVVQQGDAALVFVMGAQAELGGLPAMLALWGVRLVGLVLNPLALLGLAYVIKRIDRRSAWV